MSKYFVQVGYTAEAWAAMSRGPQRVVERVQASAEALGGSIESLYFCFGDYDLMGVVDFPDSRGVAAWSMAVSSGGDVRAFKTTTLLSIEEGLHALGRATQATRTPRSCPARRPDQPSPTATGDLALVAVGVMPTVRHPAMFVAAVLEGTIKVSATRYVSPTQDETVTS